MVDLCFEIYIIELNSSLAEFQSGETCATWRVTPKRNRVTGLGSLFVVFICFRLVADV